MTMHDCVLLNIINIKHLLHQYFVLKYTPKSIIRLYISRIVTDLLMKNLQNLVPRTSPQKGMSPKEPLSKSSENMEHKNVSPVQSQGPRRSPRKKKPVQSQELRTSPRKRKQNVENVDHSA